MSTEGSELRFRGLELSGDWEWEKGHATPCQQVPRLKNRQGSRDFWGVTKEENLGDDGGLRDWEERLLHEISFGELVGEEISWDL